MAGGSYGRGLCCPMFRKRLIVCLLLMLAGSLCTIGIVTSGYSRLPREYQVESQIAEMQTHLKFLESLYRARQEDILNLQHQIGMTTVNGSQHATLAFDQSTVASDVTALLNVSDSLVSQGLHSKELSLMKTVFVFQLLPHLMNDPGSLRPAFHMSGNRGFVNNVIGIPTVKRDKESYLMITLSHLIDGLTEEDMGDTLIIVFVGESDLDFVIQTAKEIEAKFSKHVRSGLIELLSPSASYYPDFETVPLTLGDSGKRVKWRTKQNLDTLYLMAYGQTRGTYYLMIEDDVIAKKTFMKEIKQYTASTSVTVPNWFYIEYCNVGGIGKLFKSSDLIHFITYVQLFYYNMPIDWLLESYLADRVCTVDKTSANCGKNKLLIRPKYKDSLFQHIGLYSSLKGKIQKDPKLSSGMPNHFPHKNPPARRVWTEIETQAEHKLEAAYRGDGFFWGINPKVGATIEFWFENPIDLASYTFRSGNGQHPNDKIKDTVVEIYTHTTKTFVVVDSFDEFGLADGAIKRDYFPIEGIRLRVIKDIPHWIVLSEIDLKTSDKVGQE
ncbi:unnamed protein product [Leptosia nina]|uniref:Alpha-1,3-mannosyl-glycoprotein 4-beta-N-acetylglucosaminyltransferase A n=1 Tax=Leptosia nina TaxID=320188 RepID=A0AAV1JYQ5_9NEOP